MRYGTVVIVGGGCYGSQYVRQLRRARAAGKAAWERVLVVDRANTCAHALAVAADGSGASDLNAAPDGWSGIDLVVSEWTPFFGRWLAEASSNPQAHARDTIVPSPLMPHLLFEWLIARARRRWPDAVIDADAPDELAGVPWQKAGADGTRYVSYATWTCPVNCIEPGTCPHTRSDRDWSFHRSLGAGTEPIALLRVTHRQYGVGMIDVADVIAADREVEASLPTRGMVRVATASHCHGAVAALRMQRPMSPPSPASEISVDPEPSAPGDT